MLFKIVDSEKKLVTGVEIPLDKTHLICTHISAKQMDKAEYYWENNRYVIKGNTCLLMHKHKGFYYTVSMILRPEIGVDNPKVAKTIQGTLITSSINEEVLYFIRSFMGR